MANTGKRYQKGKLYELDLTDVQVDAAQPRKYFDEQALGELTSSIEKHGVLEPVLVRRDDDGRFLLVSGERRYQASLKAGLSSIPALLTDGDPVEIAIVENLLRENLTAIEEAEAIAHLKETHNYQLSELSKAIGKAESTLSEILALAKLPDSIKNDCRDNPKVSRAMLIDVAKQATSKKMKAVYDKFKASGLTYGAIRSNARQGKGNAPGDLGFIKRFTKRVENLQPGNLDAEQCKSALADIEVLRALLTSKAKPFKMQQQPES